jgi:methionyl-tRNA formyltransferase
MYLGSNIVIKTVKEIKNGSVQPIPQEDFDGIKTAYKLNRNNCKIDFNKDIDTIYNHIRGLDPYPAAWCVLENGDETLEVKIHKTNKIKESHNYTNGHLITTKKELKVAVTNGFLNLLEIKIQGKRKMDVKSLLNGYQFQENSKLL